ncbi:MAG: ParM/StbA family protein [Gemmatimonadales bacterium]|nr:ParM/StbA family protein [Gemmatimonadales bacterium]
MANNQYQVFVFPSLMESHSGELRQVAPTPLAGLKVLHEGQAYLVGQLAVLEGVSAQKTMNESPSDLGYQVLAKAGLLVGLQGAEGPVSLVTGFPWGTFLQNRDAASQFFTRLTEIEYDARPHGGPAVARRAVDIARVEVLPEIVGCAVALRYGALKVNEDAFVVSLGYGTCEACRMTRSGVVQRTMVSAPGLRVAVDLMGRDLARRFPAGLRRPHQLDAGFRAGEMVIQRQRVNVQDVRRSALERYFHDALQPVFRNIWTDDDFLRANRLLLVGGGAHYADLVDQFKREFDGVLDVTVVPQPELQAVTGYLHAAVALARKTGGSVIGLDIGNAQTVVAARAGAEISGGEDQLEWARASAAVLSE